MVIAPENGEELCNLHGFDDEASRSEVMKIQTAQATNSKGSEQLKPRVARIRTAQKTKSKGSAKLKLRIAKDPNS